jgi:SAM-dependent methyltransferase
LALPVPPGRLRVDGVANAATRAYARKVSTAKTIDSSARLSAEPFSRERLKAWVRTPYRIAAAMTCIDAPRAIASAGGLGRFLRDVREYRSRARGTFALNIAHLYPILSDFTAQAGSATGDYFNQDLWAARKVFARRPARHVDLGSRIDGFVAHLLTFMPVEVLDIRPLESSVEGLTFVRTDGSDLSCLADASVDSLSSLHAVEHFGLGRYGDPVDPDACVRAMRSLSRVLRPGGRLYFSVPIGRERVEFNAHRIFAPDTILRTFERLQLISFSAIDSTGSLRSDCHARDFADVPYACGLFEFTR